MENVRKIQFEALDALGARLAHLDHTLTQMSVEPNPFDAEAKLYFIMRQAERLTEMAKGFHNQMHDENSIDGEMHTIDCKPPIMLKEVL